MINHARGIMKTKYSPYRKDVDDNIILRDNFIKSVLISNNGGVNFQHIVKNTSIKQDNPNRKIHLVKHFIRIFGISILTRKNFLYIDKDTALEYNVNKPPIDAVNHSGVSSGLKKKNTIVQIRIDTKNTRMDLMIQCKDKQPSSLSSPTPQPQKSSSPTPQPQKSSSPTPQPQNSSSPTPQPQKSSSPTPQKSYLFNLHLPNSSQTIQQPIPMPIQQPIPMPIQQPIPMPIQQQMPPIPIQQPIQQPINSIMDLFSEPLETLCQATTFDFSSGQFFPQNPPQLFNVNVDVMSTSDLLMLSTRINNVILCRNVLEKIF
jgi:hypothetical protein